MSIENLRLIVREPGFVHTLSFILANESLFASREDFQSRNRFEIISFSEIALLLSLLSEQPLNTTYFPDRVADQYARCKSELDAVHESLSFLSKPTAGTDWSESFATGRTFVEPIFYAAGAGFWFDHLALAPQLYSFDKDFLESRGYFVQEFADLLFEFETIFRTRFRDLMRTEKSKAKNQLPLTGPFPAFIFAKSDVSPKHAKIFDAFLAKFSVQPGTAPIVRNPISYHPAKARPALRLDEDRIFVPMVPMLCEQLFENPFFEIAADKQYFSLNANNRGTAAENIVADLLRQIQHFHVLADIKLYRTGNEIDQIDAAAIFGSTAILFETKTKRLTEAARLGETAKLVEDVRQGILDAQKQLSNSRSILLATQYDRAACKFGDVKYLSNLQQVICVSVMTHEIPAYAHLIHTILEKENIVDIIPITVFDLKVMTRYLANGFEFLYYFAVRTVLANYLRYATEQSLLGFHLKTRLNIPDTVDMVYVDESFGQFIDADYSRVVDRKGTRLSTEFGVDVVDSIVRQIIENGSPEYFRLFSVFRGMSGKSAIDLKKTIRLLEKMMNKDGRTHDATMAFDKSALTFIIGENWAAIDRHARALMTKRNFENIYEQEYILFLATNNGGRRREASRRTISKLIGQYKIMGVSMRYRGASKDRLLAFSPRIPNDKFEKWGE